MYTFIQWILSRTIHNFLSSTLPTAPFSFSSQLLSSISASHMCMAVCPSTRAWLPTSSHILKWELPSLLPFETANSQLPPAKLRPSDPALSLENADWVDLGQVLGKWPQSLWADVGNSHVVSRSQNFPPWVRIVAYFSALWIDMHFCINYYEPVKTNQTMITEINLLWSTLRWTQIYGYNYLEGSLSAWSSAEQQHVPT